VDKTGDFLVGENREEAYISWKDALKRKEFYLLWVTRLSVVLITQVSEIIPT
jgi:hypothetical protein